MLKSDCISLKPMSCKQDPIPKTLLITACNTDQQDNSSSENTLCSETTQIGKVRQMANDGNSISLF